VVKGIFSRLFGQRPAEALRAVGFPHSPFEVVETTGEQAFARWQELKTAGRGVPVIVPDIEYILEPFDPKYAMAGKIRPLDELLAAARAIRFPEDLLRMRREEEKAAGISDEERQEFQPDEGDWPTEVPPSPGLSVVYDGTGEYDPRVYIILVPTDDPATIPAYLRWGGFNNCPKPEYHVAALRHWRDRYGAELVGLDMATLNVRVARTPTTRNEALALARVQYEYCNDIVDQGVRTLRALAAERMAHDWWYFWWD
jgi:hypothetical protein